MVKLVRRGRGYPLLNQRIYYRIRIDAPGRVYFDEGLEKAAMVIDVSIKGLRIFSNCPLNKGSEVTISIDASYMKKPFEKMQAKVIWSERLEDNFWQAGLGVDINYLM